MNCANTSFLNHFLSQVEKEEKRDAKIRAHLREEMQDESSDNFLFCSEVWFNEDFNNDATLIQICCDVAMGLKKPDEIKNYLINKQISLTMEKMK